MTLVTERATRLSVSEMLKVGEMGSIKKGKAPLETLREIQKVVFVGSSCAGKSTIEKAVRVAALADSRLRELVSIPKRVVTRNPRPDDEDMSYCTAEDFQRKLEAGDLGLYGVKIMERGRLEPYGYSQPRKGTLPIYFANNQTIRNSSSLLPQDFLEGALTGVIYAPDHVRETRMRTRSPQLFIEKPDEVAFRLSAEERSVRLAMETHLIVRNFGRFQASTSNDVIELIRHLSGAT